MLAVISFFYIFCDLVLNDCLLLLVSNFDLYIWGYFPPVIRGLSNFIEFISFHKHSINLAGATDTSWCQYLQFTSFGINKRFYNDYACQYLHYETLETLRYDPTFTSQLGGPTIKF